MPDSDSPNDKPKFVLPLHCVLGDGSIKFIRRTGRPKKVRVRPEPVALDYAAEVDRERQAFVNGEMARYEAEADTIERLWQVIREIAEETAALKFSKRRMELEDRVGSEKISSTISESYVRIAKLVLEIAKLGGFGRIDPKNAKVQAVVKLFHEQLDEAASGTLDSDQAKAFWENYRARLEGWEARASAMT